MTELCNVSPLRITKFVSSLEDGSPNQSIGICVLDGSSSSCRIMVLFGWHDCCGTKGEAADLFPYVCSTWQFVRPTDESLGSVSTLQLEKYLNWAHQIPFVLHSLRRKELRPLDHINRSFLLKTLYQNLTLQSRFL